MKTEPMKTLPVGATMTLAQLAWLVQRAEDLDVRIEGLRITHPPEGWEPSPHAIRRIQELGADLLREEAEELHTAILEGTPHEALDAADQEVLAQLHPETETPSVKEILWAMREVRDRIESDAETTADLEAERAARIAAEGCACEPCRQCEACRAWWAEARREAEEAA